jgi:hypothetical protein
MDRATAIEQIRAACKDISTALMRVQPALPGLDDEPTKAEIIKASYELTKSVEIIKKQVMRLEKRDDSTLL